MPARRSAWERGGALDKKPPNGGESSAGKFDAHEPLALANALVTDQHAIVRIQARQHPSRRNSCGGGAKRQNRSGARPHRVADPLDVGGKLAA